MDRKCILALVSLLFFFSCNSYSSISESDSALNWLWIKTDTKEKACQRLIHQEFFGDGNHILYLQSMSLFDNKSFCFEAGTECYVFDIDTKEVFNTGELPEQSHHNNAQFLDIYFDKEDKYPLLLLSRGDYPPNQNEFYIVRVLQKNDSISFHRIKTIKNTLVEAKNGGSWFADTKGKKLYMYAMTKSDWRVKEDNIFCVFRQNFRSLS